MPPSSRPRWSSKPKHAKRPLHPLDPHQIVEALELQDDPDYFDSLKVGYNRVHIDTFFTQPSFSETHPSCSTSIFEHQQVIQATR